MIIRMTHEKIRNIKYNYQLAGSRCINIERKYNDEYC
jgi:hypothetical protein